MILVKSIAPHEEIHEDKECDKVWRMNFDGAQSQLGVREGIVFTSAEEDEKPLSYRPKFECTSNIVEYEA